MEHDEKYISIPFDVWENKYKRLEEENKDLRSFIELTKNQHSGNVELSLSSQYSPYFNRVFASVDLTIKNAPLLTLENREIIQNELKQIYSTGYLGGKLVEFVSQEILTKKIEAVDKAMSEVMLPALKDIQERVRKLPWIVKWLFRIQEKDYIKK